MTIVDAQHRQRSFRHAEDNVRLSACRQGKSRHTGGEALQIRILDLLEQFLRKDPLCSQRHKFLFGCHRLPALRKAHIDRVGDQIR